MMSERVVVALVCFCAFSLVASTNMRANPFDFRKQFEPPTLLFISSPSERKISYTQLSNFKSVGAVLPIIDAGVVAPYGIAWDASHSALYICDGSLRKIFRVKVKAIECTGGKNDCKGVQHQLKVVGGLIAVVAGVESQWATVDNDGNLYFSDAKTNSVNKLDVAVIDLIVQGKLLPTDLKTTSEAEAEGEESAKETIQETKTTDGENSDGEAKTDDADDTIAAVIPTPTAPPPTIFRLYENGASANVGTPSGVCAAGPYIYWANQIGGTTAGSVAYGKSSPRVKLPAEGDAGPTFPSAKLTNNTASTYGVVITESKVLYTDTEKKVWAASRGTGKVVALTDAMLKPRGLVYDGDNTAYVADEEANYVGSMPIGLLKENAPVTNSVDIHAPFGLALVGPKDHIWETFLFDKLHGQSGAQGRSSLYALVISVVSMAITFGLAA